MHHLPVSRVLVLFFCISAASALDGDNSTNTNDEDDGSFYSTSSAIFLFSFLGLLIPFIFIVVSLRVLVQVPFDIAAYCCGYRILPEEQTVGEPFYFRDRATGRESAIRYIMTRYRTPNMSDDEESYTHTFYRQHPASNNELSLPDQQDQQLVLLVPTCCPRYARVSDQWSWLQLVILPMNIVVVTIPLLVNCGALFTSVLRYFGMSNALAHTLLVVLYGGTALRALWVFIRGAIHVYGNEGRWNPCCRHRYQQMRSGSFEPIYSRVSNEPDSVNEYDAKKKSAAECLDDQIALTENVV